MRQLAEYVEYLLRHHDCVVVPGIGAFLCNYQPAHFEGDNKSTLNSDALLGVKKAEGDNLRDGVMMYPPSRWLAFNELINESDGLLERTVARRMKVDAKEASRIVAQMASELERKLGAEGTVDFGRLGSFNFDGNSVTFTPKVCPSINGALFGLYPLELETLQQKRAPQRTVAAEIDEEPETRILPHVAFWQTVRPYATGIVASLAVIITIGLFFINPIPTTKKAEMASMAPVPAVQPISAAADEIEQAEVADVVEEAAPQKAVEETVDPRSVSAVQNQTQTVSVMPAQTPSNVKSETPNFPKEEPKSDRKRFNTGDAYCLIVASFPTAGGAEAYIAEHPGQQLAVLERDGKHRVYAATGENYNQAMQQRRFVDIPDAWVCRR